MNFKMSGKERKIKDTLVASGNYPENLVVMIPSNKPAVLKYTIGGKQIIEQVQNIFDLVNNLKTNEQQNERS